jgi:serine/threonine protein phosphatase PrpC
MPLSSTLPAPAVVPYNAQSEGGPGGAGRKAVIGIPPIEHSSLTDVGVKRGHNQDSCAALPATSPEHWREYGHIFVVADGMGGHAVGEKASAQAARDIPLIYQKHAKDNPVAALRRAFVEANAAIHSVGQANPEFKGMGTTATALVLRPEGAWIGHVGDSRAYRIRNGYIEQLSFDHSLIWYEARKQRLQPEEVANVRSNVILRSLGPEAFVQVDVEGPYPVQPGDTFVLCSDGLSGQVSDREIGLVAGGLPPPEASRFLVDLANLRGGPDNITIIVVRVGVPEALSTTTLQAAKLTPAARALAAVRAALAFVVQRVPWPIFVLLGGFLLAAGAFVCILNGLTTAGAAAALVATLVIAGGLVGLTWFHAREEEERPPPPPEPRQSVYRQFDCHIDAAAVERIAKHDTTLRQYLGEAGWDAEWPDYQRYRDAADAAERAGDPAEAFRQRCRGMQVLARSFNRHRQKEESFTPKWDKNSP